VNIVARVDGKIPDPRSPNAVRLLYRYQENEPYLAPRLMRQEGKDFTVSIAAEDVHDGFFYKVVSGAVETPEYRISVRATPLLTSVQATYHFRPYVAKDDEEHYGRRAFKMEALRGTEITLFVRTNRPVKDAYLVIEGKDGKEQILAEKIEDNANAFKVKHVVNKTTRYRLEYTTPNDEAYADPNYQGSGRRARSATTAGRDHGPRPRYAAAEQRRSASRRHSHRRHRRQEPDASNARGKRSRDQR